MGDFKQRDAMMLMWYKCEKCGERERLWNSRPRVTPFAINCSADNCGGTMQHVDWKEDVYAPNHWPEKGDRIFVDQSKERAREVNQQKIEQYWEGGQYPMKDFYETKEKALESLMTEWEFGQPSIIVYEGSKLPGGQ